MRDHKGNIRKATKCGSDNFGKFGDFSIDFLDFMGDLIKLILKLVGKLLKISLKILGGALLGGGAAIVEGAIFSKWIALVVSCTLWAGLILWGITILFNRLGLAAVMVALAILGIIVGIILTIRKEKEAK